MFNYLLSGKYTAYQVLQIASEEWGLRTRHTTRYPEGRKFSQTSFYNILSNPFYYGRFEYPEESGNWYTGTHKPLITKAEFDEVQKILGRDGAQSKTHYFAYTGLMRCGHCGARITAESKVKQQKNGNIHRYKYYHCTGQVDKNCKQKSLREDRLEEQILGFLSSLQISLPFHKWVMGELKKEYEQEKEDKTSIIYNQEKVLRTIQLKLTNLKELAMTGAISASEYKDDRKHLEKEEEKIKGYLDSVNEKMQSWIRDAERTMTFAERAVEVFKNGDEEKRREIFAALGTEHQLLNRKLTIQTEKPLLVIKEMVSVAKRDSIPLEPATFLAAYGPDGKILSPFAGMWR